MLAMNHETIAKNFNLVVKESFGEEKPHGAFTQYELIRGSNQIGKSKSYSAREYQNGYYELVQMPGSSSLENVLREGQVIDPKIAFKNLKNLYAQQQAQKENV